MNDDKSAASQTHHTREDEWVCEWGKCEKNTCFNETASNKNDCSTVAAVAMAMAAAMAKALETMRRMILMEQICVINIMKCNKFLD